MVSTKKIFMLVTLVSLVAVACKPQDVSDVESLDNIGGKTTNNVCSGAFATDLYDAAIDVSLLPPGEQEKMKLEVKKTISALPPGFQRLFFNSAKGTIQVVSNIGEMCREVGYTVDASAEGDVVACP